MSVETINLSHIYGKDTVFETAALSDVSFSVEDGEFIGIIGQTGSGKCTLIQHLNRLIQPTSVTVLLDGEDINAKGVKMKDICSRVGLVFQYPEYQLFEETVYKDIAFGPTNMGIEDVDGAVREAMKLVRLDFDRFAEKSPFELSGGQKRRVALAGVLAMNPEVLILDEPASGLDPLGRKEILDNIKSLHEKKNLTIFLVSHSMTDVCEYASRIMVFSEGRLEMFDTPEKIFAHSDELEQMGLTVPDGKKLMMKLRDRGLDVNTDVYTFEGALEEIRRTRREKDNA